MRKRRVKINGTSNNAFTKPIENNNNLYKQRGQKLTYNLLKVMDGEQVLVHDLELDVFDQLCTVKIKQVPWYRKGNHGLSINGIELYNDEFLFVYSAGGLCVNGEFECYSVKDNIDGVKGDTEC